MVVRQFVQDFSFHLAFSRSMHGLHVSGILSQLTLYLISARQILQLVTFHCALAISLQDRQSLGGVFESRGYKTSARHFSQFTE
jgi:hypothetical protein